MRQNALKRLSGVGLVALLAGLLLVGCGGARAGYQLSGAPTNGSSSSGGATSVKTPPRGPLPPIAAPTSVSTAMPTTTSDANGADVTPLTLKNAAVTTVVPLGAFVQAQLSSGDTWVYAGQSSGGVLTPVAPSDTAGANGARLWTFRASTVGTTTLRFLGKPVCQVKSPCPQFAMAVGFTVRVVG